MPNITVMEYSRLKEAERRLEMLQLKELAKPATKLFKDKVALVLAFNFASGEPIPHFATAAMESVKQQVPAAYDAWMRVMGKG